MFFLIYVGYFNHSTMLTNTTKGLIFPEYEMLVSLILFTQDTPPYPKITRTFSEKVILKILRLQVKGDTYFTPQFQFLKAYMSQDKASREKLRSSDFLPDTSAALIPLAITLNPIMHRLASLHIEDEADLPVYIGGEQFISEVKMLMHYTQLAFAQELHLYPEFRERLMGSIMELTNPNFKQASNEIFDHMQINKIKTMTDPSFICAEIVDLAYNKNMSKIKSMLDTQIQENRYLPERFAHPMVKAVTEAFESLQQR